MRAPETRESPPGLTGPLELLALKNGIAYVGISDVQGDVAEFGCFRGRSAQMLAASMAGFGVSRSLWLFDSFEGLPEATARVDVGSPHVQSGAWRWKDSFDPDDVRSLCLPYLPDSRIKILKGWFKDTLSQIPSETKFSLIHIDCDLYQSTVEVLSHLFYKEMLSDGCVIFFDDWYANRGSPQYGEQRAWADIWQNGRGPAYAYTDWGHYGLIGRRFLVHKNGD